MSDGILTGVAGWGRVWGTKPHPSKASIHPTDEDLSVGAPGMGHPSFVVGVDREKQVPIRLVGQADSLRAGFQLR